MTSPDLPSGGADALPAQYDASATEPAIYAAWQAAGVFTADAAASARIGGPRTPFTIVIPPPNVTAVLHMGHGLTYTVQDVIVRWRRMAGDESVWLPGTDHAGIATQNVVEKQLAREGLSRFDLGRAAFVERTAQFVEETGGIILQQLAAIGASADWSRTAYTLSPELSRAVREAFVRLWERGLIYKGHRVIHWCPRCATSLSDEEAEFHDAPGRLYHISYPLADDPTRSVTVATTRPETLLGDVAVAVHPEDERYRDLVGRSVLLPILDLPIPVVADDYADPAFGTGVVKITPAHDANDFEVGKRHGLPQPVVINAAAEMEEVADAEGRVPAAVRGLDRDAAREWIVQQLGDAGRLVKVEAHQHAVRHCYRCDTVVEPRLSDQWFVRMAPLAAPALAAVRAGETRVLPERWEAVYVNWLDGIRDWNISRQLWWGHRIPVWYCDACGGEPTVSRDDVSACARCGGPVRQDEDVLDTWFSSWLWPLTTLGWPDDTQDLAAFYPTDVLVTAPEILFFWVARMVMAGFAFEGRAPFHSIYLHGTVRDTQHRKMSKSLGNGIDPLDVVQRYGADALRWTVVAGLGMGADVILDNADLERSFATGRNFCTKLWNIGRFLLTNVGTAPVQSLESIAPSRLTRADAWILARLDAAIADCDAALGPSRPGPDGTPWPDAERFAGLRLNEYAEAARRFVWNELADWYVESTKGRIAGAEAQTPDGEVARAVLVHTFDRALRLLHPIVPFITEALWQKLPGREPSAFLARASWPTRTAHWDKVRAREFEEARSSVDSIRVLRNTMGLSPSERPTVVLVPSIDKPFAEATATTLEILRHEAPITESLARVHVRVAETHEQRGIVVIAASHNVYFELESLGQHVRDRECNRAVGELAELEEQLAALRGRLANDGFVARAPAAIVEAERQKEREWSVRRDQIAAKVASLCGGR